MSLKNESPNFCGNASDEPSFCGNKSTILLVEDEPAVRKLLCRFLILSGYSVMDAADSTSARVLWKQNRDKIDLLLVDMILPGEMNGSALAALLQREKPDLKVVFASGLCAEYLEGDSGIRAGFVQKPFIPDELLGVVQKILEKS